VAALAATVEPPLDPVVAVPVDLDVEARLAGPVTFRMAGWLALAAMGGAIVGLNLGSPWLMLLGVLLAIVGAAGACVRPGGRPLAAWALPLLSYRRRHRGDRKEQRA
jgi:hypothetical protein